MSIYKMIYNDSGNLTILNNDNIFYYHNLIKLTVFKNNNLFEIIEIKNLKKIEDFLFYKYKNNNNDKNYKLFRGIDRFNITCFEMICIEGKKNEN